MEIRRDSYVNELAKRRDNGLAKVVTGIRRCGKSYLMLNLFKKSLLDAGMPEDHIISVDLEDFGNYALRDPQTLYSHVKGLVSDKSPYVILIDEIQHVKGFEDVVNGIMRIPNVDVYVTGSNSRFLSTDIITEFRGRTDEVRVHPLSFSEFLSAFDGTPEQAWREYYTYGGMPLVLSQPDDASKIQYLKTLFEMVYLKDICDRNGLRHRRELDSLVDVLASATGSLTSIRKLENTFKSETQSKITDKTIKSYIDHLEDAFLIEEAIQYDVKGRKYISAPRKYYFEDIGLRNARLGLRQQDQNHIMENVIFNELRARGYLVDVGAVRTTEADGNGSRHEVRLEVDFVARRGDNVCYIQSAFAMPDLEKEEQEYRPLKKIGDSFRKYVIVGYDIKAKRDNDGIVTMGLLDFLTDRDSLNR